MGDWAEDYLDSVHPGWLEAQGQDRKTREQALDARIRELEAELACEQRAGASAMNDVQGLEAENANLRQQLEHERHQADLWYEEAKRGTHG